MRAGIALATTALATTVASILAQQPPTFRAGVDTVEVHVTVRTADGQLARGLTKDDFELYDNGKRREITLFSADVQPVTIALMLDRSGSIANQAAKVTDAAEAFVGELLPDDRAAVNLLAFECQPLTSDRSKLIETLRSRLPMDPGSPIWAGLDRTMTSIAAESGRKAILMFSDGDDYGPQTSGQAAMFRAGPCRPWTNPSEATLADAAKRAQRDGVTVYTVSVDNAAGTTKDDDLRAIARDSGGERYRLRQDSELAAAFTRIADELHHQYLLGFVPAVFDRKVHDLDVRVKRPGVTVHARKSYVADRIDPATSRRPDAAAAAAPLSSADVEQAIRNGAAGQKLQASCMASAVFKDNATETDAFVDVVLEGPAGRVMRMAREAREQHTTFGPAQVTDELRAPVIQVTAEVKPTLRPAADPPPDEAAARAGAPPVKPPPALQGLVSLRLRSRELTEVVLQPIATSSPEPRGQLPTGIGFRPKIWALFDLAAFRALPGTEVEVVVRSSAIVARHCSISARDKAALR